MNRGSSWKLGLAVVVRVTALSSVTAFWACDNQDAELARAEAEKAKLQVEVEKAKAQAAAAQAEAAKVQVEANAKPVPASGEVATEKVSPKRESEGNGSLDALAAEVAGEQKTQHDCPPGDPMCAPGRTKITPVVSVTVQERKSDGKAWDAMGGAPDVLVTLTASGETIQGGLAQDRFNGQFKFSGPLWLKEGETVRVTVVDKDALQSDPIGSSSVTFQAKGDVVSFSGGSMTGTISF